MWTPDKSRWSWGLRCGLAALLLLSTACKGQLSSCRDAFPLLKSDTLHFASWCMKENEPGFRDLFSQDTVLAKAMALDHFVPIGRVRVDRKTELWIVETYTGMCGTTFVPYVYRRGADSLHLAGIPFASALYGDAAEPAEDGLVSHEEADECWLLDQDRDGDLDIVFSPLSKSCFSVETAGERAGYCEEELVAPQLFVWEKGNFVETNGKGVVDFFALRMRPPMGDD